MRLDDFYRMIAFIYGEQNAQRSATATFTHFVEVCGMLTIHDRKKKRESFDVEMALCKALGWFFPLMAKFGVRSVEELVFRKYPYACPYCRLAPHRDAECKTVRGTAGSVDHHALRAAYENNLWRMPTSLDGWQVMFAEIYPRNVEDKGRSTIGLLEELGELAEAIRVFDRHPKFFAGEAADVFSYLMGIANEYALRAQQDHDKSFSLQDLMLRSYPGLCTQCGNQVCVCPAVPEATVGRMSKELDIHDGSTLFGFDYADATRHGARACAAALAHVGGYAALARQIPLDRGEANRALVMLCVELASELHDKDPTLSTSLNAAALRIGSETTLPGSRQHKVLPEEQIILLRTAMAAVGKSSSAVSARAGVNVGQIFQPVRVLFVTSNPSGTAPISVERERRVVNEAIERSRERGRIHVKHLSAATPDSLRRALLDDEYDVLHLAGHADENGPVLEDENGSPLRAPLEAISSLVARYATFKCVILNSCLSLAGRATAFVDWVIGMDGEVDDDSAVDFAKGFYDALGAGRPIEFAVQEGLSAVQLHGRSIPLKVLRRTP